MESVQVSDIVDRMCDHTPNTGNLSVEKDQAQEKNVAEIDSTEIQILESNIVPSGSGGTCAVENVYSRSTDVSPPCKNDFRDFVNEEKTAECSEEESSNSASNRTDSATNVSRVSYNLEAPELEVGLLSKRNSMESDTSVLDDFSRTFDETDYAWPSEIQTSTPRNTGNRTAAARFLKKWKPSFIQDKFQDSHEVGVIEGENGYEKAMASLREVLNDVSADTSSKLDSYSSMLDAFKQEDAKNYDEMISTINSEKTILDLEEATKEVDEFIEEFSEKSIAQDCTVARCNTLVAIDSSDTTLIPPEETVIMISDSSGSTITDISNRNTIIISSSQSDNDSVSPIRKTCVSSNVFDNQKLPKENDLDILIIEGDDDLDINLDDEEILLASDDESQKKNQLHVPAERDLEIFISSDPEENRDNEDPNWDSFRNLGSDYERYQAVRKRWRNISVPNPKKDLTCRCRDQIYRFNKYSHFRNSSSSSNNNNNNNNDYYCYSPNDNYSNYHNGNSYDGDKTGNRKSLKRKLQFSENDCEFPKRRRASCTIIFDRSIEQLWKHVTEEREIIFQEQEQSLKSLAETQQLEKIVTNRKCNNCAVEMKRLENKHIMETSSCLEQFRSRLKLTMDHAQSKFMALQKAQEEIRQFHEFYPDRENHKSTDNGLIYLTNDEVQEILQVEEMLLSFPSFYNDE